MTRLQDQINTCRDLQSRRSSTCRETDRVISHYVGKRSHPSRIQGCNSYLPIQKERESSSLGQSSRHLFIVNCWEDPCKRASESFEWTPWTPRASTRKPVWFQERQRNNRHDLHRKTASRELSGTECGPLHDVNREGPLKIIAKFGCPPKFIAMVRQYHDDMLARV